MTAPAMEERRISERELDILRGYARGDDLADLAADFELGRTDIRKLLVVLCGMDRVVAAEIVLSGELPAGSLARPTVSVSFVETPPAAEPGRWRTPALGEMAQDEPTATPDVDPVEEPVDELSAEPEPEPAAEPEAEPADDGRGVEDLLARADASVRPHLHDLASAVRGCIAVLRKALCDYDLTRTYTERVDRLRAELAEAEAELAAVRAGAGDVAEPRGSARRALPRRSESDLSKADRQAIREWAPGAGHTVSVTGRIPQHVVTAWRAWRGRAAS